MSFFTRVELVEKLRRDLGFEANGESQVTIGSYTLGTIYTIGEWSGLNVGIGLQGTLYSFPEELTPAYGDRPGSYEIFIRIRPALFALSTDHSLM